MRITGNGLRITGGLNLGGVALTPPGPTLFTPTGTPTSLGDGNALFEMGVWNPSDPANVVDISGQNHTMGFNDQTYSGNINYAHFLNNSAQANEWDWPAADANAMTITGWFAFGNWNPGGSTSLIARTEGSDGWALRIDGNGTGINLVKYNVADQIITLNTPLSLNTWHYISVTQFYDSLIFVIDGTEYTMTGSATPFATSGGPVRLQYDPYNGGNQNAEIWMREVKVFNTNKNTTQLQNIYNAQKPSYNVGTFHSAVQAVENDGANAPCIADSYAWASSVPVGATVIADGVGTFIVTTISTPGTYGPNWRFDVSPGTSYFAAGTNLTFSW